MSWAPPGHSVPISQPMSGAAAVPAGERRHVPRRLGGEQPDDRVDVLAPERVDVPLQQLLLGGGEVGLDGVGGQAALGELGVRALEGGVDRGGRGVEGLGDLGGRPAQHVAQDQHRALAGRQVLEGGDEGEPDRVPLGDLDRGVGHRLEPGDLVVELEGVAGHRVGGAEPGGQRPAGPALEVGEADVGGDPVEPGAHRRAALELVGAPSTRAGTSPAPGPRPRAPTRTSGSSARAARAGSAASASGSRRARSRAFVEGRHGRSSLHATTDRVDRQNSSLARQRVRRGRGRRRTSPTRVRRSSRSSTSAAPSWVTPKISSASVTGTPSAIGASSSSSPSPLTVARVVEHQRGRRCRSGGPAGPAPRARRAAARGAAPSSGQVGGAARVRRRARPWRRRRRRRPRAIRR